MITTISNPVISIEENKVTYTNIYHESRQIVDRSIEFQGAKRYIDIEVQHKEYSALIEKYRIPLSNLIESIEANRGEWLYETIGNYYDQDHLEQKFLEHVWDECHIEESDLYRLLNEELSYQTLDQYAFCQLDSDRQKAYLEICDNGSSVFPDWYKHSILLIREAKRNISPENWETFKRLAA